jgi:hypothetical protein
MMPTPAQETVPIRILVIPALGTLVGVGVGAALSHDIVGPVLGGIVAGAAAVYHASRLAR